MKKICIITLTLAMAFAPISMLAEIPADGIEMSASGIQLNVNGGNVHIVGAKAATSSRSARLYARFQYNEKRFKD